MQNQDRKQKIKKYFVYFGIVLIGCLMLYLIFAPSSENSDLNELDTTLPDPEEQEIPAKENAYIEDDHGIIISDMFPDLDEEMNLVFDSNKKDSVRLNDSELAMLRAKDARNDANNILSGLNNVLATGNTEVEKMEKQAEKIDELETKLREQEANLKIAQAQAEMVAYMPSTTTNAPPERIIPTSEEASTEPAAVVIPVTVSETNIVSSLDPSGQRGRFYGTESINSEQKNTIKAVTFGQQIISNGQNLRLRLSDPIQIGQRILPANSIITAKCQIDTERLFATVSSIEYQGIISPVILEVYDAVDGQPGLSLPGSFEQDAIREVGADVAMSVGATTQQSVSVFSSEPNAAEQIKTDVGRGIISGLSRFASRKLQEIKVTVQDGHRVFLVTSKQ
jgi:conjugative transposon TraM protein